MTSIDQSLYNKMYGLTNWQSSDWDENVDSWKTRWNSFNEIIICPNCDIEIIGFTDNIGWHNWPIDLSHLYFHKK